MPARGSQNGDHSAKARAELQHKLRQAVALEAKVGDEVDRLLSLALEQGWSDRDLVDVTGFPKNVVTGARHRGGHRLPTLLCKACGDAIERTGRRGRPATLCGRCR